MAVEVELGSDSARYGDRRVPCSASIVARSADNTVNERDSVADAVSAIARGGFVVVVDDENRENEGDLVLAAEFASTNDVAFFLEHTSGLLCVALSEARADELGLPMMVAPDANTERHATAFLVSVDLRVGTTTGISAGDRAATARALASDATRPEDLARPGHVFPLRAQADGVLARAGHTEAAVDLCTMAGLAGAAVISEIVAPGRRDMMDRAGLLAFAEAYNLPVVTIADLVTFRQRAAAVAISVAEAAPVARPAADRSGDLVGSPKRGRMGHRLALTHVE